MKLFKGFGKLQLRRKLRGEEWDSTLQYDLMSNVYSYWHNLTSKSEVGRQYYQIFGPAKCFNWLTLQGWTTSWLQTIISHLKISFFKFSGVNVLHLMQKRGWYVRQMVEPESTTIIPYHLNNLLSFKFIGCIEVSK